MEKESRPWMVGYRVKVEGAFNSRWQGRRLEAIPNLLDENFEVFEFWDKNTRYQGFRMFFKVVVAIDEIHSILDRVLCFRVYTKCILFVQTERNVSQRLCFRLICSSLSDLYLHTVPDTRYFARKT